MRERPEDEVMQKNFLDFLLNLLKDQLYVALAYMTGILPVKKLCKPWLRDCSRILQCKEGL